MWIKPYVKQIKIQFCVLKIMQTSNLKVNHHYGGVLYFDLYKETFLQRKLESV